MSFSFNTTAQKMNGASSAADLETAFLCAYYDNLSDESEFIQSIDALINRAEIYLDECVSSYRLAAMTYQLAIVLDIDETSLSNYLSIKSDNFSNDPVKINERYHKTDSPAIKPVLHLFQKAVANNVNVFFITARKPLNNNQHDDLQSHVIENLLNAGYSGWTGLYMPKVHEFDMPSAAFKTNLRERLTSEGYKIILNIGDQETDLEGGYADMMVKIPNPLYGNGNATIKTTFPAHASFFSRQNTSNQQIFSDERKQTKIQLT